ncbi:MAG: hypothetical protein KIT22_15315 [Verrucomicrobiae bacterium]|nr:hypothetical protein [Verrucomicrobiae bacterium]
MKTILIIGPHRFLVPSASIAQAIAEALREAPQVERHAHGGYEYSAYVPAGAARKIDTFRVDCLHERDVLAETPTATPSVRALLDLSPRAARRTRRALAAVQ